MILTKELAMSLKSGQTIYYIGEGINKVPKVNRLKLLSKCKTWKRDISRYELSCKYGLYDYFKITNDDPIEIFLTEQDAQTELKMQKVVTALKGN